MTQSFDLIVIGAGTAALGAANKCAAEGWSVAIVDKRPYGGTCALRGCDPKKILRRGAEIIDAARLLQGKGIEEQGLKINWADLVAHKQSFTDKMPAAIESNLKENGVVTFHGSARFLDAGTIEINGDQLQARHFLIASGAGPRPLDVPGSHYMIDSTRFMELTGLPERVLFVGAGYISFEFAHMAARAGTEVRMINRGTRALKGFDPDLVDRLLERSSAAGIDVQLGAALRSIETTSDGFVITADQDGQQRQWHADLVVHGAGRVPELEELNLQAAGVETGKQGVVVNDYLQSVSNPVVYAAGDAADTAGAPLTPVASFEGKVAASNMLKGNQKVPDYRGVPSVIFTVPELARVGLLESEAESQGLDVAVKFTDTSGWFSNLRVGEPCAAVKILIDNRTDEIVGAHLLGPEYSELINLFALAIKLRLKSTDLKSMVAAYPTVGSDLGSML